MLTDIAADNSAFSINAHAVASHLETHGFVVLQKHIAGDVVAAIKAMARRHLAEAIRPLEYEADLGYPGAPRSRRAAGGRTVRRLLQAYDRQPIFRRWLHEPATQSLVRELLGAPRMTRAHHNCIMTKHPVYSSDTGWHQDIRYWHFASAHLLNLWLALGDEHPGNGGLWIIPGSHQMTFKDGRFDQRLFFRDDLEQNRALIRTAVPVELKAGDLLVFDARCLHRAGRNLDGEAVKYTLVFSFHGDANYPLPGTRSSAYPEVCFD